jgi:3-oxoacid CoA-transferase subunit A
MNKVVATAAEAVADIRSGSSVAVGGFGLNGIPEHLIEALLAQGATNLVTVSNNCGVDGLGLGRLLDNRRLSRTTGSYVGENKEFERQYLSGDLEVELVPQGTLAERLRAGGSGIPAFFTPAGVGTQIADGGLEEGIVCDYALVHATIGDTHGNLYYNKATQNFNPLCAMAGRITIAEVERLVEPGELTPEQVHTPGIFVQRVVVVGSEGKRIERTTTRKRGA